MVMLTLWECRLPRGRQLSNVVKFSLLPSVKRIPLKTAFGLEWISVRYTKTSKRKDDIYGIKEIFMLALLNLLVYVRPIWVHLIL